MDMQTAKENMVKQQIRTNNVADERILNLISQTQRDFFVPNEYRSFAYSDSNIPIGHRQVMMIPQMEALMLDALNIKPTDKVLEIGTGSGYITYLLAQLAQHVYSVDIFPDFTESAADKLKSKNITNVTLQTGNAAEGWSKQQPYDVIVITGALQQLPDAILHELKVAGRLFVILGRPPAMEATLITRESEDNWREKILFETEIPYLLQTLTKATFTF